MKLDAVKPDELTRGLVFVSLVASALKEILFKAFPEAPIELVIDKFLEMVEKLTLPKVFLSAVRELKVMLSLTTKEPTPVKLMILSPVIELASTSVALISVVADRAGWA